MEGYIEGCMENRGILADDPRPFWSLNGLGAVTSVPMWPRAGVVRRTALQGMLREMNVRLEPAALLKALKVRSCVKSVLGRENSWVMIGSAFASFAV